jgi:signal-transduction protein with cAMP-binding, CBS, and nucleotidyltransferase domain
VLGISTVVIYMKYRKIILMHIELFLDVRYNYGNKNMPRELINFIFYKMNKVVSILIGVRKEQMEDRKYGARPVPWAIESGFQLKKQGMANHF